MCQIPGSPQEHQSNQIPCTTSTHINSTNPPPPLQPYSPTSSTKCTSHANPSTTFSLRSHLGFLHHTTIRTASLPASTVAHTHHDIIMIQEVHVWPRDPTTYIHTYIHIMQNSINIYRFDIIYPRPQTHIHTPLTRPHPPYHTPEPENHAQLPMYFNKPAFPSIPQHYHTKSSPPFFSLTHLAY